VAPAEMYKTLFYECYKSSLLDQEEKTRMSEVSGTVSQDDEPQGFEAKAS
jgi:hypothetical protein